MILVLSKGFVREEVGKGKGPSRMGEERKRM